MHSVYVPPMSNSPKATAGSRVALAEDPTITGTIMRVSSHGLPVTIRSMRGVDIEAASVKWDDSEGWQRIELRRIIAESPTNTGDSVISAMWSRVESIPDTGEGGRWHLASDWACEIAEDWRMAHGTPTDIARVRADFNPGLTLQEIRSCILRDAAKCGL